MIRRVKKNMTLLMDWLIIRQETPVTKHDDRIAAAGIVTCEDMESATVFVIGGLVPPRFASHRDNASCIGHYGVGSRRARPHAR
jgi:hypothetical protein